MPLAAIKNLEFNFTDRQQTEYLHKDLFSCIFAAKNISPKSMHSVPKTVLPSQHTNFRSLKISQKF